MTREETIKALGLMEHVESIVATYEPGERREDTTVRELKEACRMAAAVLRAQQALVDAHGQWQGEGDGYADGKIVYDVWKCSRCGHIIDDGTDDPDMLPNYCPDCGAKMDGDTAQVPAQLKLELDREAWGLCCRCQSNRVLDNRFCCRCGRPLTEEAWAELERAIGGAMERLTYKSIIGGWTYGVPRQEAVDRLAAYEDTGLTPEEVIAIKHALMGRETAKITEFEGIPIQRLQELAQAEKDGRLVVLQDGITIRNLQDEYYRAKCIANTQLPSADYTTGRIAGFGDGVIHILDKTLFRKEAEAALKKREEEDNETN